MTRALPGIMSLTDTRRSGRRLYWMCHNDAACAVRVCARSVGRSGSGGDDILSMSQEVHSCPSTIRPAMAPDRNRTISAACSPHTRSANETLPAHPPSSYILHCAASLSSSTAFPRCCPWKQVSGGGGQARQSDGRTEVMKEALDDPAAFHGEICAQLSCA